MLGYKGSGMIGDELLKTMFSQVEHILMIVLSFSYNKHLLAEGPHAKRDCAIGGHAERMQAAAVRLQSERLPCFLPSSPD